MEPDLKRSLGARVRAARRRRGLTQEQLAELVGRTVEAVSNIERGTSLPSLATVERLSRYLEVPIVEFFEEGAQSDVSARRRELELEAREVIRLLPDHELEIALAQLKAFAGAKTSSS